MREHWRLLGDFAFTYLPTFLSIVVYRVPSADRVRIERIDSPVNRATSYSAGTQHTSTTSADYTDELSIYNNNDKTGHHRHAWTSLTSVFPAGKPPLPPVTSGASNFSDTSSQERVLSRREEDLSEEWLVYFTR